MTASTDELHTDAQDTMFNRSRIGSVQIPSLTDDDFNCCFNCNWGESELQRAEVYMPTASVYVPEVEVPQQLSQIETSQMPEVQIQPPTPLSNYQLRQQRLMKEYRKTQLQIERSLDHPVLRGSLNSRRLFLHLNFQNEGDCRATTSEHSGNRPEFDKSAKFSTNYRPFSKDSLRRRKLSSPSLLQIHQNKMPCYCMVHLNPYINSNSQPILPQASGSSLKVPARRTLNPKALQNSRAHHLNVHSPPDQNCVVLSGLPMWPANVIYGWLIFICSHHRGFREVYLSNTNLAFVEFSSDVFARDACIHLNGLRLTQSSILRATHAHSRYDMPLPYPPNPASEQLI